MPAPSAASAAPVGAAASQATIALLQANSLTSVVHAEIERLILDGELAPGAKLTEAMLADRLGVSRGPIREAFRILEEAGLVRLEKNRGVFVRSIPLDEAMEIYDLRAMLDESAGRQLAERITAEQARELRTLVEQMERLVKDGHNTSASDPYHLMNLAFHDRLVEFVGNRKLIELYRRLVKELSLFRRVNLADGKQVPVSVQEHRAILKAITAGDADAAGRALRAHVLESKERTLKNHALQARPVGATAATLAAHLPAPRKARHA
ncbi:MAG: phosphonate utilization associated transcriptional regulator [Aquabacterium sp.]|nr:phosphonate utilization associated transcriptional regulator [Aquabacterium sp.]